MHFERRQLQVVVFSLAVLWLFAVRFPAAMRTDQVGPAGKDFITEFGGTRCLFEGCNPYRTADVQAQFLSGGGSPSQIPAWHDEPPVYPPATFIVLLPFAVLPFSAARILWMCGSSVLFILAAWMAWRSVPPRFSWIAVICASIFVILSGGPILHLGQPALPAIALFVIASIFFLRNRHLDVATLALLLSLALKPQLAGLAALYFLWQKVHPKRVAISMAGAVVILLAGVAILQMRPVSRTWLQDWRSNIAGSTLPGAINDPRPEGSYGFYEVNLDSATSVIFSDEASFHRASLALFVLSLAFWVYWVHRCARSGVLDHSLALAGLSVLTLLPVYHRDYDQLLLIMLVLSIPAMFQLNRALGSLILIAGIAPCTPIYTLVLYHFYRRLSPFFHNKIVFLLAFREKDLMLLLIVLLYCVLLAQLTRFTREHEMEKQLRPAGAEQGV